MSAAIYPFTAIVGQERMKRALILNAVNPQIGGVLVRGEKGTAKSTAARALAALLPRIEVVTGCPYSCDPSSPAGACDACQYTIESRDYSTSTRQIRIVDLPISATEDRVVGTLDIEKAIQQGERHFDPGVLASANRGILYVDEVNLLDDHVVDLLLDSAAMGVNVVEREGISFSHPAHFMLIGTMNPEEGDLRPQLLDRFALCVDVFGLKDPNYRMEVLERRIGFDEDPEGFYKEWQPYEDTLAAEIEQARQIVNGVTYSRTDLETIANLTSSMEVDGHRADLVILKTARAHAAFESRRAITERDILLAAELALPHRFKRSPFENTERSIQDLQQRLEKARADAESTGEQIEDADGDADAQEKKTTPTT